jgi:Kef-type K+ transport system membrane component KefB
MTTTEIFLIAMLIIFTVPYLVWRLGRTDYYEFVFNPKVIQSLNGIAWWGVMIFVWIAGVELDLQTAWTHRVESGITAGLALAVPLAFGSVVGAVMLLYPGWIGAKAMQWQFVVGIGMACAVTALPILILLMEKLEILRKPLGQRILRYASLDDIAIWGVLALILMDWDRVAKQGGFLLVFAVASIAIREYGASHQLASGRWCGVYLRRCVVDRFSEWQTDWHLCSGENSEMVKRRQLLDRLAASNQSINHDHLCQRTFG